jgi:hypothetical protein
MGPYQTLAIFLAPFVLLSLWQAFGPEGRD